MTTSTANDPVMLMRQLAPQGMAEALAGGAGFAVAPAEGFQPLTGYRPQAVHEQRKEWPLTQWTAGPGEQTARGSWRFSFSGSDGMEATAKLRLDRQFGVAVYQPTLINPGARTSPRLADVASLFLQLNGQDAPAVLYSAGASSSSGWPHTREYPAEAFRTRWIAPSYPRPIELGSGAGTSTRRSGSSVQNLPIFMLIDSEKPNKPGMFVALEWSTSWLGHVFFGHSRDVVCVKIGPLVKDLVLKAGESLELPAAHVGFFEGGFEAGTNACRRYIHQRLMPRYQGKLTVPPVAYTLWPGLAAPYDERLLKPHVDKAAELGVEMFCVDADWCPGLFPDDTGTWEADPEKFPSGLEAFAEYVKSKGMGMGLAFDAAVAPGTRLHREHPEFVYDLPHGFLRHKFHFGKPEACDYVIELISDFVRRCDLRYIRADFGLDPADRRPGEPFGWHLIDPEGKAAFRHVQGLYRVWQTLIERHPDLMLELNNGGGNGIDFGAMRRHYCGWGNDMTSDPHACHNMQLGANQFIQPHFVGLAVGPNRAGKGDGLDASFPDLSFLSRMSGELLLHGALGAWPDEVAGRARHWITVYKKIRHLLVQDYYRLLPPPQSAADWDAGQFCDGSQEGVVFVFRNAGHLDRQFLFLQSLDDKSYQFRDESSGAETVIAGKELQAEGFCVDLNPNTAKLYSYRCV